MGYAVPELQDLIDGVDLIEAEYCLASNNQPNPQRLQLIELLRATISLINQQPLFQQLSRSDCQDILFGAYLYCIDSITAKYKLLNPSYSAGYIYNSGSKLHRIILQQLGITKDNHVDDKYKLCCVNKFYQVALIQHRQAFATCLEDENLDVNQVDEKVKTVIRSSFAAINGDANKLIRAIPTEDAISMKMSEMLTAYQTTTHADNEQRKFLAKLCVAFSHLIPASSDDLQKEHFIPRTQRIKMGLLLYISQSIYDSYVLRSPTNRSALYTLACEAMNIQSPDDIDSYTRLACLTAFNSLIKNEMNGKLLENELQVQGKVYIDSDLRPVIVGTERMMEVIQNTKPKSSISPVALTMAGLGALIGAAPGYGVGYAIGFAISQTNEAVMTKMLVSKLTSPVMGMIMGNAGSYLGYYASDLVLDAALERAFAKIFEALGMLMGASVGGMVGLVVYDLSYKTLMDLCGLYKVLQTNVDLGKDADPMFVDCLLTLPPDVFSEQNKDQLRYVIAGGPGMFTKESKDMLSPLVLSSGDESLLSDDESIEESRFALV